MMIKNNNKNNYNYFSDENLQECKAKYYTNKNPYSYKNMCNSILFMGPFIIFCLSNFFYIHT